MQSIKGKILKGVGGKYEVLCEGETYTARARGVFRHDGISPQVGDNVTLRLEDTGEHYIDRIAERKNLLIRPPLANLDYMLITAAAAKPAPVLETLDKLSVICAHNAITPVFVITKCDLARDVGKELAALYRGAGFTAFTLADGDEEATKALRLWLEDALRGHTAAFAGASGIGKSTLLNRLFPRLSLTTGEISEKISRGKHTTRHVELFPLCGGFIADTPGFSMLDFLRFDFMDLDALAGAFAEFAPYLGRCRYKDCTHLCEEGCAIVDAVANGKIAPSRHESYKSLYHTLKNKHAWTKIPH